MMRDAMLNRKTRTTCSTTQQYTLS